MSSLEETMHDPTIVEPTITVEEHADPADQQTLLDGLLAFNTAIVGDPKLTPFSVFLRSEGAVVGGLIARLSWGWLFVEKFWIAESHRGQGHGTRLLAQAERFARDRGCHSAHLGTLEFQALPFYERQGYRVWGVLEGFPPGFRKYHVRKSLV